MKKLLVAAVLAAAPFAATSSEVVEADHIPCGGIIDKRPSPERFAAYCSGLGENGWFRANGYCYTVEWVIRNGEVVDKIYHYGGPYHGPDKFKGANEESEESTMICPTSKPYLATGPGLEPWIGYWHDS